MASLQLNWEKKFEIGIEALDEQHKNLILIYNKLAKAFLSKNTETILLEILKELNDYSDYHFRTEETFFKENHLTGLEDHIKEHEVYQKKVKQFENTNNQGVNIDFSLLSFLKKWWSDHILIEDKKYSGEIIKA